MECSYVKGNLYKINTGGSFALNLSSNEASDYSNVNSIKYTSAEGEIKEKNLVFNPHSTDLTLNISDCIPIGYGINPTNDTVLNKYYLLLNPNGLVNICSFLNLPMPVDIEFLKDNFVDFGINLATDITSKNKTASNLPVVCAVTLDSNSNPTLIKLYRGNYTPTEEEINTAKLYWAGNPL